MRTTQYEKGYFSATQFPCPAEQLLPFHLVTYSLVHPLSTYITSLGWKKWKPYVRNGLKFTKTLTVVTLVPSKYFGRFCIFEESVSHLQEKDVLLA